MNRRFDYGKIALVLTAIILGIFAADFFRRLWIDWGNARGKLNIISSNSSSLLEVEPGTSVTSITQTSGTDAADATGEGSTVSTEATTTSATQQQPSGPSSTMDVQNASVYEGSLLLIDGQHPLKGNPAQTPFTSIKYEHFRLPVKSLLLNNLAIDPLVSMFKSFYASTGLGNVMVYATTLVPQSPAYSANIPERASGLSIDLSVLDEAAGKHTPFTGDGAYAWILEHAADYGFILRYPADKAAQTGMDGITWHYRYIGKPHAQYMKEQNLCLEEYLTLVRTHPWEGEHVQFSYDNTDYQVYYVPASQTGSLTQVPYPDGWEVSVSGDNIDGFIVTCSKAVS